MCNWLIFSLILFIVLIGFLAFCELFAGAYETIQEQKAILYLQKIIIIMIRLVQSVNLLIMYIGFIYI